MPDARLIVCQRTGNWTAGLRRVDRQGVDLHQTSSLPAALRELHDARGSLLAVEMTADNVDLVLEALWTVLVRFPWARTIVLAQRGLDVYEPLARELGAVWFTTSPRDLRPALAAAKRHQQRVPAEPRSLRERIWARLPWRAAATAV